MFTWNSLRKLLRPAALFTAGVVVTIMAAAIYLPFASDPLELRWADGEVRPQDDPHYIGLLGHSNSTIPQRRGSDADSMAPPDWKRPTVSVYSTPNLKPEPPPLTLKDLSAEGQAKVIDLLTRNSGKDEAWLRLSRSLAGATADVPRKDPYRAERVLIATVAKGLDDEPGNRLLWTRIFIQPINFRFAGYTVAATDNRTVRIATIEDTANAKLSFEGGLEKVLPGQVKAEAGSERKVQADVAQQYEGLGVDIQPGFLRIIRESAAGGDVAGNTGIALSILTDPAMIVQSSANPLHGGNEQPNPTPTPTPVLLIADEHLTESRDASGPSQPRLTVLPEDALPHCALKARVWMLYEARQIMHGGDHYQEGRQHVQLTRNADGIREVEIVPADDIAPAVWSIGVGAGNPPQAFLLAQARGAKVWRKVVFTDYVLASQLIHWLKEQPPSARPGIDGLTFSFGRDGQQVAYSPGPTLAPYKDGRDACKVARAPQDASR